MPTYPLAPQRPPGMPVAIQGSYGSGGLTPQTKTWQLPGYGVWLVDVFAFTGNQNSNIGVSAIIRWFRYDASGAQTKTLTKTDLIGVATPSAEFGASGTVNPVNLLTISNPSTTGLVTVTVGWNDGASKTPYVNIRGAQLRDLSSFAGA